MILGLLATTALATDLFEPALGERYTEVETFTQDGELKLWSAIERHHDPDRVLFAQEALNDGVRWIDADYSPHIATTFTTGEPHSASFLLHMGLNEPVSRGTPILMVPGAGHGVGESRYAARRRMDFFVRHLLGVEPRAK